MKRKKLKPDVAAGYKPILRRARKTTPKTQREAFKQVKDKLPLQEAEGLEVLKELGSYGATVHELREKMQIPASSIMRVVSGLITSGRVRYYKDRTRISKYGKENGVLVYVKGWDKARANPAFIGLFEQMERDHGDWEQKRKEAQDLIDAGRDALLKTLDKIHGKIRWMRREGLL